MPKKVATQNKKKLPSAPLGAASVKAKKNPLFEKRSRNFRIGGDIQPKRDLTRFVKWPKYIRLQRQKRILLQRIKVPATLAQFEHTAEKNLFAQIARLCKKQSPETRAEKKDRLKKMAEAGDKVDRKAPTVLKYGVNHVFDLVEQKKARFVAIAHDVDPIEIVTCLPALCRKKDIPYVIVKGKSRLGQLVHKKTATCIAITDVRKEDSADFQTICESARANFNDNVEVRRRMGGGIRGVKSNHIMLRRQMALERELAKKTGLIVN